MIILYTDREGGDWIPFNTPLNWAQLQEVLAWAITGERDFPAIFAKSGPKNRSDILYPEGDNLPRFHSILVDDGERWDVINQKWASYKTNDGEFRRWWNRYIADYKPFDDDREYWWRDQGQPVHDVLGMGTRGFRL